MIKKKINNKRGQQEIVGFVLIVVIVVIVGVVFLGISLGGEREIETENAEMTNFLISSLRYTSDCTLRIKYADNRDLIKAAHAGQLCLDDRPTLDILNKTYTEMLANSKWRIEGADRPTKYYKLSFYPQTRSGDNIIKEPSFLEIEAGDEKLCTTRRAGRAIVGEVIVELSICRD